MPELLRAWGEAIRGKADVGESFVVITFAILCALLLLFAVGAIAREAQRFRGRSLTAPIVRSVQHLRGGRRRHG